MTDGTLTNTTILGQSRPGSNGNEIMTEHFPESQEHYFLIVQDRKE